METLIKKYSVITVRTWTFDTTRPSSVGVYAVVWLVFMWSPYHLSPMEITPVYKFHQILKMKKSLKIMTIEKFKKYTQYCTSRFDHIPLSLYALIYNSSCVAVLHVSL